MVDVPRPLVAGTAVVCEAQFLSAYVTVAAGPVVDLPQFSVRVCHVESPSGANSHFFLFPAMKSTFTVSFTFSWAGKSTLVPSLLTNLTFTGSETFFSALKLT